VYSYVLTEDLVQIVVLRDANVPMEFNSGAAITLNSITPIEWLLSFNSNSYNNPVEWRSNLTLDANAPIFWLKQLTNDRVAPLEWGGSVQTDTISPIEFNTTRLFSPSVPVEWRSLFTRDTVVPTELNALAAWTPTAPVEWSAQPVFDASVPVEFTALRSADQVAPLELNMGPRTDYIVPVDWGQPAQTSASITVPLEFVSRIFEFRPADIDFGGGKLFPTVVPVEWRGSAATTQDAVASIEWRGGFVADVVNPAEWRSTIYLNTDSNPFSGEFSNEFGPAGNVLEFSATTLVTHNDNVGWGANVARSVIAPVELGASFSVSVLQPVEWRISVVRDIIAPIAIAGSATGATGDANAPLSFSGGIVSDAFVISDFLTTKARNEDISATWITSALANYVSSLEVLAGGSADMFAPNDQLQQIAVTKGSAIDWAFTGVVVDTVVAYESLRIRLSSTNVETYWTGLMLSPDIPALVEWAQGTAVAIGDTNAPMEVLSLRTVDIVIDLERLFGRGSIGAALEPDEWEREHE
jgi:hypothetical protein